MISMVDESATTPGTEAAEARRHRCFVFRAARRNPN
jgi:hypothetical protein